MAAGWMQIATQTIRGKGRVWTVSINRYYDDTSAAPAPISPRFERMLKLTYGDSADIGWSTWRLPSFLSVRIRDEGGDILNHLSEEIDERRFRLSLSDSLNQYAWQGYLRRPALRRPLVTSVRAPFIDLVFTDGLGTLSEDPPVAISAIAPSLHEVVYGALFESIQAIPIQYAVAWKPSNVGPGAYMEKTHVHLNADASGSGPMPLSLRRAPRRLVRRAGDQLEDIATAFNARVFQGLRRTATGTSQWWFQQRFLTGRAVSLISGAAQFFDGTTLTVNSITSDTITLLDEEIDAATGQIAPLPRTTFVTVTRDLSYLAEVFLGRDRFFQHWTNPPIPQLPSPQFWQTGSAPVRPYTFPSDHEYFPDKNGLEMEPFAYAQQAIGYVAQHDEIVLAINAYHEQSDPVAVLNSLYVMVWIEPFDPAEPTYYLKADVGGGAIRTATWVTSEAEEPYVGVPFTLRPIMVSRQAIPVSGLLWIKFTGGSVAPHVSYLTNAGVSLHPKEALSKILEADTSADLGYEANWKASFSVFSAGKRIPGETANREHAWANVRDEIGMEDDMLRVSTTASLFPQAPVASWLDETGATWYDLTGLEARDLLDQQSAGGDQIITRVRRITPPEARYQIGGQYFTLNSAEIDLIDEVSDCVFTPLTKSVEV